MFCPNPNCRHRSKRKLRPLVISIISDDEPSSRHERIKQMFSSHPSLAAHFEPPVFSPGVPSRDIRNRLRLLQYSRRAGLIPDVEWAGIIRALYEQTAGDADEELSHCMDQLDINPDVISSIEQNQHEIIDPFKHLAVTVEIDDSESNNGQSNSATKKKKWPQTKTTSLVPISPHRKGSAEDISVPYSVELWQKAKSLSRDRSVFGCTLAHLIAMKKLIGDDESNEENDFDFVLEDNVRAFVDDDIDNTSPACGNNLLASCECASRIWDIIESSNKIGTDDSASNTLSTCHLRYFGWLGSLPNLTWLYNKHIPRKSHGEHDGMVLFPFPTNDDFELDSIPTDKESVKLQKKTGTKSVQDKDNTPHFTSPGGTAVFGTFAYTISKSAYHSLIDNLQNDVGALMWKSKKMRAYHAKPIDKILPRLIRSVYGETSVHLPQKVAFVRCPMLGSLLHPQWEEGFCQSTELQYQLSTGNNDYVWDYVWMTDEERQRVAHRKKSEV
jgi:hypothetical protein